jgi:hypothetical protein
MKVNAWHIGIKCKGRLWFGALLFYIIHNNVLLRHLNLVGTSAVSIMNSD